MRAQFWIASHLFEPLRVRTLELAVRSLAIQSSPPNEIWLSLSVAPTVHPPSDEELASWAGSIPIRVIRHPERRLQFEHLRAIWEQARQTASWVAFCDDDDMCGPERLRSFWECLKMHPHTRVFKTEMFMFTDGEPLSESFENALTKANPFMPNAEFAAYICHMDVLSDFFSNCYENALRICGGTLDIVFTAYVSRETPVWAKGAQYAYRRSPLVHDYGHPPGST